MILYSLSTTFLDLDCNLTPLQKRWICFYLLTRARRSREQREIIKFYLIKKIYIKNIINGIDNNIFTNDVFDDLISLKIINKDKSTPVTIKGNITQLNVLLKELYGYTISRTLIK